MSAARVGDKEERSGPARLSVRSFPQLHPGKWRLSHLEEGKMQIYIFASGAAFSLHKRRKAPRQSVRTPQPPGATALQAYLRSAISTNFTNERRFFGRTKRVHLKIELNRKKNARKNLWIVPPQSGRDADVASLAALPHLRRFPARGAGARGPGLLASPAALLSGRRPRCLAALSAVAAAAAIFFVSRRIPTEDGGGGDAVVLCCWWVA